MKIIYAWVAGIIDGEGNIGFISNRGKPRPRLQVTSTDYRILDKLKSLFDGSIHENIRKDRPKNKQCWNWVLQGQKAINCIKSCYPYFISKEAEAGIFIAFEKYLGKRGKLKEKQELIDRLKKLRA